jgi:hypothetical protein
LFLISIELFGIDRDATVLEEENGAEVCRRRLVPRLILFRNIISIELGYDGSDWNRIVQGWDDVVSAPMFVEMGRKRLVVFGLACEVWIILQGEFH